MTGDSMLSNVYCVLAKIVATVKVIFKYAVRKILSVSASASFILIILKVQKVKLNARIHEDMLNNLKQKNNSFS